MADNINLSGFSWVRGKNNSSCHPPILNVPIATGYAPAVDPAAGNHAVGGLYRGDPITRLSTGYGALCPGTEDTTAQLRVFGIMQAVGEDGYWNGEEMFFGSYLPSGIAYGTNESRRTYIKVIPAVGQVFDVAVVSDSISAKSDVITLLGNNADHRLTLFDTSAAGPKALPKLSLASPATTTAQWRIWDFSKAVELFDYSGAYPRLEVTVNESLEPETDDDGV